MRKGSDWNIYGFIIQQICSEFDYQFFNAYIIIFLSLILSGTPMDLIPINLKSNDMALNNCLYLPQKLAKDPDAIVHVKVKGRMIKAMFSQIIDSTNIGASKNLREYLGLDLVNPVKVLPSQPLSPEKYGITEMRVDMSIKKNPENVAEISEETAVAYLKQKQVNTVFNIQQSFYVKIGSVICQGIVKQLKVGKKQAEVGVLTPKTIVDIISGFKKKEKSQKQTPAAKKDEKEETSSKTSLFKPDFKAEQMGIGGLDEQLFNIFRRTFASRRFSDDVVNKFGVKHVKGILLYGPPGTGKTLIARQLAKSLNIKEQNLKIINGPEVFSKFVGESEQNIRKLFSKAREDETKYGPKSPLHIIVFDQIDAICKQRGVHSGGTGVNDQVVNQLLSVIDGVDALNNIVVIGMTNRKDLIDEAILRPGRFQIHIEISLPNAVGRQQILNIHTLKLQQNKLLHSDCRLEEIAQLTRNYTGAEIEALIKSASSYSITRNTNVMDFSQKLKIDESRLRVEKQDFLKALEEVKPQFGIDEDKFNAYFRQKVVNFGGSFDQIVNGLAQATKFGEGARSQVKSALLYGPQGSGKTTLAVNFAKHCSFSYIKIISPQNFVGQTDSFKIQSINKIFDDAYKTTRACIVIDNIERLIEFTAIGLRFSNAVLQTLLVLTNKIPPNSESKLLIIGTTSSYQHMQRLGLPSCFTTKIQVPALNAEEISNLVEQKFRVQSSNGQKIGKKLKGATIRNVLEVAGLVDSYDKPEEWTQYYKLLIEVETD